jgi:nucleoside-diphosphate-sugar epimerase
MSIDASTHSLFGVSKAAAELLVQEYGRYFGMSTAVFRGGCLTGPGHSSCSVLEAIDLRRRSRTVAARLVVTGASPA